MAAQILQQGLGESGEGSLTAVRESLRHCAGRKLTQSCRLELPESKIFAQHWIPHHHLSIKDAAAARQSARCRDFLDSDPLLDIVSKCRVNVWRQAAFTDVSTVQVAVVFCLSVSKSDNVDFVPLVSIPGAVEVLSSTFVQLDSFPVQLFLDQEWLVWHQLRDGDQVGCAAALAQLR